MNIKLLKTATNMNITRQLISLCLVIGMTFSCYIAVYSQDIAIANTNLTYKSYGRTRPLTIGDQVPDFQFNLLNYPSRTARLSDFRGKLVILDFWATWCGSCIGGFNKLEALYKQYKDKIVILAVTNENPETVKKFIEKNKVASSITFPLILGDSILHKFFPHSILPHEVFLDNAGVVKAITSSDYITIPIFDSLLNGLEINLPVKKDLIKFDRNRPIQETAKDNLNILHQSFLSSFIDGVATMGGSTVDSVKRRLYYINMPILMLYQELIDLKYRNKIILDVKDSTRYNLQGTWSDWAPKNTFCYELTIPIQTTRPEYRAFMLQDLNKMLGIRTFVEKRLMDCWVIKRNPSANLSILSKGSKPMIDFSNQKLKKIYNQPFSVLLEKLNPIYTIYPYRMRPIFIDETNLKENVDMDFELTDFEDIGELKNNFKRFGLELTQEKREIEIFIITDKLK